METRGCFCGKEMRVFMEDEDNRLWACDPNGCGRLLLEDKHGQGATWYLAEMNDKKGII